ncbi:MAG: hypothetical protein KF726_00675 [Anaerolineae bacterium]|nr:hypothetical protein [Anaerolineae bacterium]
MNLGQSMRRFTMGLLLCFAIVIISLAQWSGLEYSSLLARADNPRLIEAERAIQRGLIVDRHGTILAESIEIGKSVSGKPIMGRDYPYPEAASVVGYYSLRYGVGGVEAAFDDELRGNLSFVQDWLHEQQIGSDVRLTIDLPLQQAITAALGRKPGAVVVLDAPSGAVRALVSLPGYDPNQLDATYDNLRLNPFAPLLNRVTQGIYQPGGALQTIILASMLTAQTPIDQTVIDADQPLEFNGLTLGCAGSVNPSTLIEAYAQACPPPFVDAAMSAPGEVQEMFDTFGLLQAPTLVKFGTVTGRSPTPLTNFRDPARLRAQISGQGDLTVTPLQMALVAVTIANQGNTVTPYLVDGIRIHGATDWQPINTVTEQHAVISTDVAAQIREAMRRSVIDGAAKAAQQDSLTIYGHASFAYTGVNANSWFIGFIELSDGSAAVVAVVIEGEKETTLASQIGGIALREAASVSGTADVSSK